MAQIQAHVGCHLVITRASRVQTLAGIAHQRRQALLDIEMHILKIEQPDELAAQNFIFDLRHATADVVQILSVDDIARCQHLRVGERALNVEQREALVKFHRSGKTLH